MKKNLTKKENKPLSKEEYEQTFNCMRRLFGQNACKELQEQVKELSCLTDYMVFDDKEKTNKEYYKWVKEQIKIMKR